METLEQSFEHSSHITKKKKNTLWSHIKTLLQQLSICASYQHTHSPVWDSWHDFLMVKKETSCCPLPAPIILSCLPVCHPWPSCSKSTLGEALSTLCFDCHSVLVPACWFVTAGPSRDLIHFLYLQDRSFFPHTALLLFGPVFSHIMLY